MPPSVDGTRRLRRRVQAAGRWLVMNVGMPEQLFLYKMVESDQAKTHEGEHCHRPSCSHDRGRHRDGVGEYDFALVCQCSEFIATEKVP